MTLSDQINFAAIRADLRTHLEAQKRTATRDIRNYPQPIAGCDAQIPALWKRRDNAVEDLRRLADFPDHGSTDDLKEFIVSCSALSADVKQNFIDRLHQLPARAAAE